MPERLYGVEGINLFSGRRVRITGKKSRDGIFGADIGKNVLMWLLKSGIDCLLRACLPQRLWVGNTRNSSMGML